MSPRFRLEGIYTPLVMLMKADASFDLDALADVVDRGVDGLVSGGSNRQNYAHNVEERLQLAHFVKNRLNSRLLLFVGIGAMRTEDLIALDCGARSMGADGLLLGTPPGPVSAGRRQVMHPV